MKIAHISDLHYVKKHWGLSQFFSKRWVGNFNAIFSKSRGFDMERLDCFIKTCQEEKVDHIVIAGDLSTTSFHKEFSLALEFVHTLKKAGFQVTVIPGNHDNYTWCSSRRKLFYRYFDDPHLRDDRVSSHKVGDHLWFVLIDTTFPTPIYKSTGRFTDKIEENLEAALHAIPDGDKVIAINHFPLFHNDAPKRWLEGAEGLQTLLHKHKNVVLYLHGHTHRHTVADLRENGLPIVLDSGSVTYKKRSTFNLLTLSDTGCHVDAYAWDDGWQRFQEHDFSW